MTKPQQTQDVISYIESVIESCSTLNQLSNAKMWAHNFCRKNKEYKMCWQQLHTTYQLKYRHLKCTGATNGNNKLLFKNTPLYF